MCGSKSKDVIDDSDEEAGLFDAREVAYAAA
jgi:hypothetical protein